MEKSNKLIWLKSSDSALIFQMYKDVWSRILLQPPRIQENQCSGHHFYFLRLFAWYEFIFWIFFAWRSVWKHRRHGNNKLWFCVVQRGRRSAVCTEWERWITGVSRARTRCRRGSLRKSRPPSGQKHSGSLTHFRSHYRSLWSRYLKLPKTFKYLKILLEFLYFVQELVPVVLVN